MPDKRESYDKPTSSDDVLNITEIPQGTSPPADPSMEKAQETVTREFDGSNEFLITGIKSPGTSADELAHSLADGKMQKQDDRDSFANALRLAFRTGGADAERALMEQINERLRDIGSPFRLISGPEPTKAEINLKPSESHHYRLYNDRTGEERQVPTVQMNAKQEMVSGQYAQKAADALADGALTEPERKHLQAALSRAYQAGGAQEHADMVRGINDELKKSGSPHRLITQLAVGENHPDSKAINKPQMSQTDLINIRTGERQSLGRFNLGESWLELEGPAAGIDPGAVIDPRLLEALQRLEKLRSSYPYPWMRDPAVNGA